jgi:hypothetical protein
MPSDRVVESSLDPLQRRLAQVYGGCGALSGLNPLMASLWTYCTVAKMAWSMEQQEHLHFGAFRIHIAAHPEHIFKYLFPFLPYHLTLKLIGTARVAVVEVLNVLPVRSGSRDVSAAGSTPQAAPIQT